MSGHTHTHTYTHTHTHTTTTITLAAQAHRGLMVYNIAIIAQFRCVPRKVKIRHYGFLFLFLRPKKTFLK